MDLDCYLSHFQMQLRRLSKAGQLDLARETKKYYDNREEYNAMVAQSEWGKGKTTKEIKQFFTSLLYGANVPPGMPAFVEELWLEQACIRRFDAKENANLLKKCSERPRPEASLEYFLNEHEERLVMDAIVTAGAARKLQPWSFEHDGIVGSAAWKDVRREMEGEGVDLTEKPIPQNWDDLRQLLVKETGLGDWPAVVTRASNADVETVRGSVEAQEPCRAR